MMMQKTALSVPLLMLFAGGCATSQYRSEQLYEGDLPPGSVSIIHVEQCTNQGRVEGRLLIAAVDKQTTNRLPAFLHSAVDEVSVLPGKHLVTLTFRNEFDNSSADFWLVTSPGQSYVGRCEAYHHFWHFHFEDSLTRQPAGGASGSADEPPDVPDPGSGTGSHPSPN